MVRGEVGLVYCKAAQTVYSTIPTQHGNCQKDRAFRVSSEVVRQSRSMGTDAVFRCSAKPENSDRSNSCAHFR